MNDKVYTYDEVHKASLEYFGGDELATNVFVSKYALTDGDKYYELTPIDMHHRLARELARIESKYPNPMSEDEIFGLLDRFKYIVPQGSPSSAIGNPYQIQSCGNCYVLDPPRDSYGSILRADQELVQLMKRRAGVGLSLDNIRPKGLPTKNAAKTTDGISVFMQRFSNSCREVAQEGRRGAEMQMLSVHHPEIETFINIKRDSTKVTGANVSVKLTDEFMYAVKNDYEYEQRWPVDAQKPVVSNLVKARTIWNQIVDGAWESADPGVFFIDAQKKYTPSDIYGIIDPDWISTATNPCGEIGMGVDSCRLLVVNLYSFVNNKFTKDAYFDYEKFSDVVVKAQRLMDDIVDIELECMDRIIAKIHSDPEPDSEKEIELNLWKRLKRNCINGRRTGLGITAIGDTLAGLGIRYGNQKSIEVTEEIYKTLAINAYKSTCIMAQERGTFPLFNFELEKGHPFLKRIWDAAPEVHEQYYKYGRRNIALTTTAPTGSLSLLTQTSSGIEPVFMLKYDRFRKVNKDDPNVKIDRVDNMGDTWQKYVVYHHALKTWMDITGKTDIEKSPYWKATANDIDWLAGVKLQSRAQYWIDHSISRTTNLPRDIDKEIISDIYMAAWESGCKGFTIYREGCKEGVLVASEDEAKIKDGRPATIQESSAPKRPKELSCEIHHATVKGKKWTVLVGLFDELPYEVFTGLAENFSLPSKCSTGKIVKHSKGVYSLHVDFADDELIIKDIIKSFDNPESAWATRMISTSLRHGVPVEFICDQLSKDGLITDVNKVLARILKKYITDGQKSRYSVSCFVCNSKNIVYVEGCMQCSDCGNSKCG